MPNHTVYNLIKKRRSARSFLNRPVKDSQLSKILEAGCWAPSGLNNQPWRFIIIKNKSLKDEVAEFSKYSYIIKKSACLVLVFLDKENSYHLIKDAQAIGACIQNMLLCALEIGISSCWVGEIINKKDKVNEFLDIKARYDLMAAVVFGYTKEKSKSRRFAPDKLILKKVP